MRGEVAASTCAAGKSPRTPFVAFKTAQSSCSEDVLRILKPLKPAGWRPGFPTPTPGQSHRTSKHKEASGRGRRKSRARGAANIRAPPPAPPGVAAGRAPRPAPRTPLAAGSFPADGMAAGG